MSKKLVTCNRCGTPNLSWGNNNGRWVLADPTNGTFHDCPVREIKEVKCKYCSADDLWWSREKMESGETKNILMESWGLPHGCEERRKFLDEQSQAKKDEYAKEKVRIESLKDGDNCGHCSGGVVLGLVYNNSPYGGRCTYCRGSGKISALTKKQALAEVRRRIWPYMKIRD